MDFTDTDLDPGTPVIDDDTTVINSDSRISTPCPLPRSPNHSEIEDEATLTDDSDATLGVLVLATGSHTRERRKLRKAIGTMREKLASSTAMVKNLQARNGVQRAENQEWRRRVESAANTGDDDVQDESAGIGLLEEFGGRKGVTVIGVLALCVGAYFCWCWFNEADMTYIRQRRRETLGLQ